MRLIRNIMILALFWAKALFANSLTYPGLKAGVIGSQCFPDFSPKL